MRFQQEPCALEIHAHGEGVGGTLIQGDIYKEHEPLLKRFGGQIQTIYLDPPFHTGKQYVLKQWAGEEGWRRGRPFIEIPAYADKWADETSFLSMIREAAEIAHQLLREDGSFFLHIDSRMHARVRLLLDEIFGAKNFTNEIIWAYQTGGRATTHFSRKHDVILFYRKSPASYFNLSAVGIPRKSARSNHMKKATDEKGRSYRAIVSQGKEYRYYDDQLAYPGDVWVDISHLQQKDPERTGYGNQKPLKLLERVILTTTRPNDLVCDLFAGSGTTAVAAIKHGRRYVAMDSSDAAINVARKRLLHSPIRIESGCASGSPRLSGHTTTRLGLLSIWLTAYELEENSHSLPLHGVDAVDQISAGYFRAGAFCAYANAVRTKSSPALPEFLEIPMLEGRPAILTVDILNRRMVHILEESNG